MLSTRARIFITRAPVRADCRSGGYSQPQPRPSGPSSVTQASPLLCQLASQQVLPKRGLGGRGRGAGTPPWHLFPVPAGVTPGSSSSSPKRQSLPAAAADCRLSLSPDQPHCTLRGATSCSHTLLRELAPALRVPPGPSGKQHVSSGPTPGSAV